MDLPTITLLLISAPSSKLQLKALSECWKTNDICTPNVAINGNVLFDVESETKLQYTASFKHIGEEYSLFPGKYFTFYYSFEFFLEFYIILQNK